MRVTRTESIAALRKKGNDIYLSICTKEIRVHPQDVDDLIQWAGEDRLTNGIIVTPQMFLSVKEGDEFAYLRKRPHGQPKAGADFDRIRIKSSFSSEINEQPLFPDNN